MWLEEFDLLEHEKRRQGNPVPIRKSKMFKDKPLSALPPPPQLVSLRSFLFAHVGYNPAPARGEQTSVRCLRNFSRFQLPAHAHRPASCR